MGNLLNCVSCIRTVMYTPWTLLWCYCGWSKSLLSLLKHSFQITLSAFFGWSHAWLFEDAEFFVSHPGGDRSSLSSLWNLLSSVLQLSCSGMLELPRWNYISQIHPGLPYHITYHGSQQHLWVSLHQKHLIIVLAYCLSFLMLAMHWCGWLCNTGACAASLMHTAYSY